MRLLDVHLFLNEQLKSHDRNLFYDIETPSEARYAILSHRWNEDGRTKRELTFQDLQPSSFRDSLNNPVFAHSLSKIKGTCLKVQEHGIEYVWIDSCCIDRRSSVELNGSIASMFKWYELAEVCFAYLSDVTWSFMDFPKSKEQFINSAWFTRGWTLQELLAPKMMVFFDTSWHLIDTREGLSREIQEASGIESEYVNDFKSNSQSISIAKKMSWVSKRKVKKEEDMAYCLFGILDVRIDVREGEGKRAFLRLQETLIQNSRDESIFAWQSATLKKSGLLAPWPDCFRDSGNVQLRSDQYRPRGAYSMTNQGLSFPAPSSIVGDYSLNPHPFCHPMPFRRRKIEKGRIVQVPLYCWVQTAEGWRAINVSLGIVDGIWQRVDCHKFEYSKSIKWKSRGDFSAGLLSTTWIDIPQTFPY